MKLDIVGQKRQSVGDRAFDLINVVGMMLLLVVIAYPLWFVIIASFSSSNEVMNGNVIFWPKGFNLRGYIAVLGDSRIMISYRNTIFYTVVGTVLNVIATIALSYPLSKKDFAGRNLIMMMLTFTMFFSGGLIPTYLTYKELGMVNSMWVMILPGLVSVYNTILMRTYFMGLPKDLEEAAYIDGCGTIRTLISIILPLSKPILAVMVVFYGVSHWNEYFTALIYLTKQELKPLALILRDILVTAQATVGDSTAGASANIMEQLQIAETIKYALIIVSTLPVMCLYPFAQKYFAKGVMIGAIKG